MLMRIKFKIISQTPKNNLAPCMAQIYRSALCSCSRVYGDEKILHQTRQFNPNWQSEAPVTMGIEKRASANKALP